MLSQSAGGMNSIAMHSQLHSGHREDEQAGLNQQLRLNVLRVLSSVLRAQSLILAVLETRFPQTAISLCPMQSKQATAAAGAPLQTRPSFFDVNAQHKM